MKKLLLFSMLLMSSPVHADEQSDIKANIAEINQQVVDTTDSVNELKREIASQNVKIDNLTKDVEKYESKVERQARNFQINGQKLSLTSIIFSNESFLNKMKRWYAASVLTFTNRDTMTRLGESKDELSKLKRSNETKLKSLESQKSELSADVNDLTTKLEKIKDEEEQAKAKAQLDANIKAANEAEAKNNEIINEPNVAPATNNLNQPTSQSPVKHGDLEFGPDGLLVEDSGGNAQAVINLLLGPGTGYVNHSASNVDQLIDTLTTPQAIYVIHRIEGAGFGQTAAGHAGIDSPVTHQAFVKQQIDGRFEGSVHLLLKKWGTFPWSGY